MKKIFTFSNFSFWYPNTNTPALKNVNLEIKEGEFVLIVGPNGGGKSSLIKSCVNIIPGFTEGKTKGKVYFKNKAVADKKLAEYSSKIGLVLQNPDRQITNLTIGEECSFGAENLNFSRIDIQKKVKESLKVVNLSYPYDRSVFDLSGGEKQRLVIASLLALGSKILILDEPTANLDPWGVEMIAKTLNIIKNRTDSIVLATHLINPFIKLATRIVIIADGKIEADFPSSKIKDYNKKLEMYSVNINIEDLNNINPLTEKLENDGFLNFKKVEYEYEENKKILNGIDLILSKKDHTVLLGENGSGKSTLARIAVELEKPTSGFFTSKALKKGMIMQNPDQSFIGLNVLEEIKIGSKLTKEEIENWLEKFNLMKYQNISPFLLSDGERRRLSTAVALAHKPDLLIIDETTAGLDAFNSNLILDELDNFNGVSINITHDKRVIKRYQKNLILLDHGLIKYHGALNSMNDNIRKMSGINL